MSTLNICSRIRATETKRFQVTVKDLDQNVKVLSEEISKALETPEDGFGMFNLLLLLFLLQMID